jgi:hypothetical protein
VDLQRVRGPHGPAPGRGARASLAVRLGGLVPPRPCPRAVDLLGGEQHDPGQHRVTHARLATSRRLAAGPPGGGRRRAGGGRPRARGRDPDLAGRCSHPRCERRSPLSQRRPSPRRWRSSLSQRRRSPSRRGRSGQGDPPPASPSGSAGRGRWSVQRLRWRCGQEGTGSEGRGSSGRTGRGGRGGSGRTGRGGSGRTGRGAGGAVAGSSAGVRTTAGSRRAGRGFGLVARSRDRPAGGLARPRPGGSTWMTPGPPRSGTGGSSCSATGWANDSTSSSLVATMAASDVAASEATPRATTTEALRRDDTRGDPLRRRWTGGRRPGRHRQARRYA